MNMSRAFMSHSHKDNDFAVRLARDLRTALGDEDAVWYDSDGGLVGGDAWWSKIQHEIGTRPVFIVVLSPDAMASNWVNDEIDMAWRLKNSASGKNIIPVMCSACEPRQDLSGLQIVSFLPPHQYAVQFSRLLDALRRPSLPPTTGNSRSTSDVPITSAQTDQAKKVRELVRRECQRNLEKLRAVWWQVNYEPAVEGTPDEIAFEKQLRISRCPRQTWERNSMGIAGTIDAFSFDELDAIDVLQARLARFNEITRAFRAKFGPTGARGLVNEYEAFKLRGSPTMYVEAYAYTLGVKLRLFSSETRPLFSECEGLCNEALQRGNPISNDADSQGNNHT